MFSSILEEDSLTKPYFGLTSAEVAIICPETYIHTYAGVKWKLLRMYVLPMFKTYGNQQSQHWGFGCGFGVASIEKTKKNSVRVFCVCTHLFSNELYDISNTQVT